MMIPQKNNIDYVKKYRSEGLNVIPCRVPEDNGGREDAKKPAIAWKEFEYKKFEGDIKSDANIAIICGKISNNLVVVDVDKNDINLVNEIYPGAVKKTRVVRTGSGGYHIYFRTTELPIKPLRLNKENGDHIDVQVDRTYVVAPPSIHPNGHEYTIISDTDQIKSIDFQEVVVNLEKAGFKVKKSSAEEIAKLSKGGISQGNRHSSAITYCHLLYYTKKFDSELIQYEMKKWNETLQPPLPQDELDTIVSDCLKYQKNNPKEDKTGKRDPRGSHTELAESILVKYNFKTLRDTEEILVYEHGVYRPNGRFKIKEESQIEKEDCYNNLVAEIIGTVQRKTGIDRDEFDSYPNLLNLENGILDIEKGVLLVHSPEHLFRIQLPIEYNPDKRPEKIMKFLHEVLEEDYVDWVLDFVAYCLVRNCKQEKALMCVGLGGNGKSTFLKMLFRFLGEDNVSTHSISELTYDRFALADLDAKLANMHSDIESSEIKRTGKIKQLISGDPISAQHKNLPPFTLQPFAKLVFSSNQMPDVNEEPDAFFQRWLVVDFANTFRGTDRENKNLLDELTTPEEFSGLLNEVMKRMPKILKNEGVFKNAPSGYELKRTWKDHANSVESFINNQIMIEENAKIAKEDLYNIYLIYCRKNTFKTLAQKTFSERVNKSLIEKIQVTTIMKNGKNVKAWKNLKIKSMPSTKEIDDKTQPKIDSKFS